MSSNNLIFTHITMKKLLFISMVVAMAVSACCTKPETYDFSGKTLVLKELAGEAYDSASTVRAVELIFMAEENALAGNVGCNLVRGSYYVNADTLMFPQPMAMTRMMCDEVSNDVEMKMTDLLNKTNRYAVNGTSVSLYAGEELLGVFEIVAPAQCCKANGAKCCKADGEKKCCKGDSVKCCKADSAKCCKADSAKTCMAAEANN